MDQNVVKLKSGFNFIISIGSSVALVLPSDFYFPWRKQANFMTSFGQLHMSLNCSSGLFFIPSYLIIKGRKRFCRRRTVSSSCQFTRFRKRRQSVIFTQDRQINSQGLSFLPRWCCSISNVCGLFVYYISGTAERVGLGGALAPPLFWLIKLLFQFFSKVKTCKR